MHRIDFPVCLSRILPAIGAGRNPAGKSPEFSSGRTKSSIRTEENAITMKIVVRPDGIFQSSVVLNCRAFALPVFEAFIYN
jgi:hypothetical protein